MCVSMWGGWQTDSRLRGCVVAANEREIGEEKGGAGV